MVGLVFTIYVRESDYMGQEIKKVYRAIHTSLSNRLSTFSFCMIYSKF